MNYAIRLPVAFLLGLAFATALFWVLWVAVSGTGSFGDLKPAVKIDFTRCTTTPKPRRSAKRSCNRNRRRCPRFRRSRSMTGGIDNANVSSVSDCRSTPANLGHGISVGSDRDVIPLVRINPEYPNRARERGIEGWVQVQFTITPAGTVADVRRSSTPIRRGSSSTLRSMPSVAGNTTRRSSTDARWNVAASMVVLTFKLEK